MTVPVIAMDQRRAEDAFDVRRTFLKAERDCPKLSRNPQWIILRQDAYERFHEAFVVLS